MVGKFRSRKYVVLFSVLAGTGDGSCPAFPYRSTFLDHVAGCPRYKT
jgi:hypothetical protein